METFLVEIQNGNIKKDSFLNDGLLSMGSPFSLSHVRRGETESLLFIITRKENMAAPPLIYYTCMLHYVYILCRCPVCRTSHL